MSEQKPKPNDTIETLIKVGFIVNVQRNGQEAWTLSTEGMFAAAILYHMLSDEARASMPKLDFPEVTERFLDA